MAALPLKTFGDSPCERTQTAQLAASRAGEKSAPLSMISRLISSSAPLFPQGEQSTPPLTSQHKALPHFCCSFCVSSSSSPFFCCSPRFSFSSLQFQLQLCGLPSDDFASLPLSSQSRSPLCQPPVVTMAFKVMTTQSAFLRWLFLQVIYRLQKLSILF